MTSITPIQESASEHLRNALQIAVNLEHFTNEHDEKEAFASIERSIRLALTALGEPNAAMIAALRDTLKIYSPLPEQTEAPTEYDRYLRDVCAILLRAQVVGWTS